MMMMVASQKDRHLLGGYSTHYPAPLTPLALATLLGTQANHNGHHASWPHLGPQWLPLVGQAFTHKQIHSQCHVTKSIVLHCTILGSVYTRTILRKNVFENLYSVHRIAAFTIMICFAC